MRFSFYILKTSEALVGWKCAEQLSLCSDSSRCVNFWCAPLFRTRVTGAQSGASWREGWIKRCVDHDHGRLWLRRFPSQIDAFLLFAEDVFAFCLSSSGFVVFSVRRLAETLPGVTWTVNQRLGYVIVHPRRKLHGGFHFFESGRCWHGRLGSTEVSEEWEVGWGAGFGQELRGETRFPAVRRTLQLRYAQPREVLQAALVLPSGLVSL